MGLPMPVYEDGSVPEDDIVSIGEVEHMEEGMEGMVTRLLEAESELDDIFESLEGESLAELRHEVRDELSETRSGAELDAAVEEEMSTYEELRRERASSLEAAIALLQEELEDAGIDLFQLHECASLGFTVATSLVVTDKPTSEK